VYTFITTRSLGSYLSLITPVGIKFLPVKRMGDLYSFDISETKPSNQVAPSTTIFREGLLKSKTTFVVKYISASDTAT